MYPVVQSMNFDQDMVKQTLISLNWAMVQEDYIPGTVSPPPHTFARSLIRLGSSASDRSAIGRVVLRQTNISTEQTKSSRGSVGRGPARIFQR